MILHLRAKPNATVNALQQAADGGLTVRLKAPAQDGKANACLLAFLAEVFGVAKRDVSLLSGHTAPFKKVEIGGISDVDGQLILTRRLES